MTGRGLRRRVGAALPALAVLLGACAAPTAEQPGPAAARSSSTSVAEHAARSDDLLTRTLADDEPGCSAAVGIEGTVVWSGAGGLADLASRRPLEPSTAFDIASVSKQFTATAALLFAQDGRLSLDDALSRWLPGLPAWADRVTVADLVHQTSGIPDYIPVLVGDGAGMHDPASQDDALEAIAARTTLDPPPGTEFEYSNSNYVLLAEVVRGAAGRPLADVVQERIATPLDLDLTVDPSGAAPDNPDPSHALAYVLPPGEEDWQPGGSNWQQVGDGSVQTTSPELVRWADNYRTGRVGGEELLAAQVEGGADTGDGGRYGAGIAEQRDGSLGHNGSWAGYLSDFWVSADRRTAIAVTCNGDRGPSSALGYLAPALRSEWT